MHGPVDISTLWESGGIFTSAASVSTRHISRIVARKKVNEKKVFHSSLFSSNKSLYSANVKIFQTVRNFFLILDRSKFSKKLTMQDSLRRIKMIRLFSKKQKKISRSKNIFKSAEGSPDSNLCLRSKITAKVGNWMLVSCLKPFQTFTAMASAAFTRLIYIELNSFWPSLSSFGFMGFKLFY